MCSALGCARSERAKGWVKVRSIRYAASGVLASAAQRLRVARIATIATDSVVTVTISRLSAPLEKVMAIAPPSPPSALQTDTPKAI